MVVPAGREFIRMVSAYTRKGIKDRGEQQTIKAANMMLAAFHFSKLKSISY